MAGATGSSQRYRPGPGQRPPSLVISYDALKEEYVGLPPKLTIPRGSFYQVQVGNLNPLYRLRTIQQQIIITYATPNPLALVKFSKSDSFQDSLTYASTLVQKLSNDFAQLESWANTTALDEATTKQALQAAEAHFIPLISAVGASLTAAELQAAVVLLTQRLDALVSRAKSRATTSSSPELTQALEIQARFAAAVSNKNLPRYWVILREAPYTQTAAPVQVMGDRVLLTIDVVKRDDFPELAPPQWEPLVLTIHATHFFTMDVSAGLLLNGLRDKTYSLRDEVVTVNDTVRATSRFKTIQEHSGGGPRPALASLLNVRYKWAPDLSYGLSVGVAATDAKTILQYHAGGSVLFGDRQRIVLTAGLSWGQVRRLREDFTVGQRVPATQTDVPTRTLRDRTFMVALTYNISSTLTKLVQGGTE